MLRGRGQRLRRDWSQAVAAHEDETCRVCGEPNTELAHVLPRTFDRRRGEKRVVVHPLAVVRLCHDHHDAYDQHELDLEPHLTSEELRHAFARVGAGPAMRRITGRRWLTGNRNADTLAESILEEL